MEQFGEALAHQSQHGQRNEPAKDAQRHRLRLDRLLHLAVNSVEAAHGEVQTVPESSGQLGQLRLQGRDAPQPSSTASRPTRRRRCP